MKTLEECKDEVAREKQITKPMAVIGKALGKAYLDEASELYVQSIREHYEAKLEEKDAEIERLKGKWISVKERLPELNGGNFFVYYEDDQEFGIARFSEREIDESHWNDSSFSVYPSHWMQPNFIK